MNSLHLLQRPEHRAPGRWWADPTPSARRTPRTAPSARSPRARRCRGRPCRASRVAVTRGSFWRSEPAAALRGLANTGLPASVIDTLSRSNASVGQEHLAAHLDQLRHRVLVGARQPVRHGVDRLDVGRDVLAGAAVAAGQRPHQPAVLVEEVDRQPVDLQLAAAGPGPPRPSRSIRAYHASSSSSLNALSRLSIGSQVVDRGELRGDRAADLLGRRVGRAQLGPLLLELLQPAQPDVVVGVGQRRVVEHEVAPAGVLDLLGELLVLGIGLLPESAALLASPHRS